MKSYIDILRTLFRFQVKYLIVGGIAVNLHGVPRMTYDLDLLIEMTQDNLVRALNALQELDFKPRLPVSFADMSDIEKITGWVSGRNLMALSFLPGSGHQVIDIILSSPLVFEDAYNARMVIPHEDFEVYIVSLDDLITMKKSASRMQDEADILHLMRLKDAKN